MGLLLPVGAVLIAIGTAGSAAACLGNSVFDGKETETLASQMDDPTETPAGASEDDSPRVFLAPLSGLMLAIGLVCVGIGIGNWCAPRIPGAINRGSTGIHLSDRCSAERRVQNTSSALGTLNSF
jgi:hypothetical protein